MTEHEQNLKDLAAMFAIYVVLGVLYESFAHPFTVLTTLPSAGVGAVLALMLFRTDLSVIAVIGVILLIGIVKKNAILMIDFALVRQRAVEAQVKTRLGQVEDEQTLRVLLHPRADRGAERGKPQQTEIPVSEGNGHPMPPGSPGIGIASRVVGHDNGILPVATGSLGAYDGEN